MGRDDDALSTAQAALTWGLRGAGAVLVYIGMKAVILGIPLLFLFAAASRNGDAPEPERIALVFAAAVIGGGLGGAAYGAVGRRFRRVGRWGDYAAGIVIAVPYTVVLMRAMGEIQGELPLLRPLDRFDVGAVILALVIIGPVTGHSIVPEIEPDRFPRPSRG